MVTDVWNGSRLGDGPIVISADWDDGTPANRERFLYASADPAHRPVRVPCLAFGRFLCAHQEVTFLSRNVPVVVGPLIELLRGTDQTTARLVSAWTLAGGCVDVFQLLRQCVEQRGCWHETLDEGALLGVSGLLGGGDEVGGLKTLLSITEMCQKLWDRYERVATDRARGHGLLAELFDALRELAAPLFEEASAETQECGASSDEVENTDNGERAAHVVPLPGTDGAVAPRAWELLGNTIDVWAGVVSQQLARAELVPDSQQIRHLRRFISDRQARSWGDANRHYALRECFEPPRPSHGSGPVPVPDKLAAWLADQAGNLHDDDHIAPDLTPVGEPPSIDPHGFWAAANPAVAACRELLRYNTVSGLLGRCAGPPWSGFCAGELDAYRRMARASSHTLFAPPCDQEFWVVRPQAMGLHTLAAIFHMRGHYAGVLGRLHHLLTGGYRLAPGLDASALIADELEAQWQSTSCAPPSAPDMGGYSVPERTMAFLDRVRQGDAQAHYWVRTARALIDTATFGVPDAYLTCVFRTDYGLDWSERQIVRLRSLLSKRVIPELAEYWEDQRVTIAARRLDLPDEVVHARLKDQIRCVSELGHASQDQLRATAGAQLMKDVAGDGDGRVVALLERLREEHGLRGSATTTQLLRALLLTRNLTGGGRIAGPAYGSAVRYRQWTMMCEEVRLGAVQELLADGSCVVAATADEILLQSPAGRADPVAIRESAERGCQRVLGQFGCRFDVERVRSW